MLRYTQEEYNFKLSLKNVVLPRVDRKQTEKISDDQQKKLISYLKANISLTAFGIMLSLFMGLMWTSGIRRSVSGEQFSESHLLIAREKQRS